MKTVIIADDLTGACDTAVKMCGDGRSVKVYLNNEISTIEEPGAAVNTNSRSLSPSEAFEKVSVLAHELKKQEHIRIYKKIDSLFRGNVMAETEALLEGLGYQSALINAAVPGNHRKVRDGKLAASNSSYNGMDIISTAFCGREDECAGIPLEVVRQGSGRLAEEIEKFVSGGKRFLIVDSETKEDVAVTAQAAAPFEGRLLLSGAAGFITPFMEDQKVKKQAEDGLLISEKGSGPLLYVLGTNNPVTVEQVNYLTGKEQVPVIPVHVNEILRGNKDAEKIRGIRQAETVMKQDPDLVLLTVTETDGKGQCSGFDAAAENMVIAECCTDIAAALAETYPFRGMVVSGGATAQMLLEKMGIHYISVLSEFAPGIPVAGLDNGKSGEMLIATKSGGYGEKETLYDLKFFL